MYQHKISLKHNKKMEYQENKKYDYFNYNFFLLICVIILFNYSEAKNIKISFINNGSLIKIKFVEKGQNMYLSSYFHIKLLSVVTDKQNTCNDKSICNIKDETRFITLNFDNTNINSCENMFKGLSNIKEIDLSEFNSSRIINMAHMFEGCSNLEIINFGNINTSNVINMEYLFYGCSELKELDLSNFVTSSVINMRYMFALLFDLKTLKLSENFKTSNVINMAYMFYYISSLELIDLSMFNTSQVTNMSNMFSEMWNLKYLTLANFNTSKVKTIENMFKNCFSLYYLDIKNFVLKSPINIEGVFQNSKKNLKVCLNDNSTINYLFGSNNVALICSSSCIYENNKYINKSNNECVVSCAQDLFIYGFFCINKCPNIHEEKFEEGPPPVRKGEYQEKILVDNNCEIVHNDLNDGVISSKCFKNCKSCAFKGNENYNNCTKCKSNFTFLNDTESIKNNCYEICPFYYFFDRNKDYQCVELCKEKYNKIIFQKRKCIDECTKDNIFKLEFKNNICIENCPLNTKYNKQKKTCEINNKDNSLLDPKSYDKMVIDL